MDLSLKSYDSFLRAKVMAIPDMGITVSDDEISAILKPHQRAIVKWALRRGRAAIFAAFGLGKTIMQLEILRLLLKHIGGRGLIVAPLGVRGEFLRDAKMIGISPVFVRSIDQCSETGLYITNYETVRDGKLDPRLFKAVSLDEAACLRGFGGTKTFRQMMGYFEGSGLYRFVATATPSPNDFIELLAYSAFLDVMDVSAAKTQAWRASETTAFVSKPIMYGAGVNLQQANHAIFLGVGYKFFDFIQAVHRIHRFLQKRAVRIDIIYTEAEREIRRSLEQKWDQHKELVGKMTEIIRRYGLGASASDEAARKMEVTRREVSGENWRIVNNDCVLETAAMDADSVHLVLTSIPFSTQYEYSPSFRDFGHTESNEHFWTQMDFLIPQLLRILKPGRVAAIHVKDRITPSGLTGMGFQTVYPFSDDCVRRFVQHGFGFLARKTIVTDVVRENNQTYRLGWTEQCKDGSRMGAGLPEYLLLFRKPPTDISNGYADDPVVKNKNDYSLDDSERN